jgi:hypothetical protein
MAPVAEVAGQYRTFRTAPHRTCARASVSRETRTRDGRGLSVQSPLGVCPCSPLLGSVRAVPFCPQERECSTAPSLGGLQRSWQPQTLHCTALPAIVGLGTRRRYTAVRRVRRQSVSRRRAVAGMSACTGDDPFGNTKQDLYTEVKGTYARPRHSTRVLVALIGPDRSL